MTFKRWLFLAVLLFAAGLVWGLTFSVNTAGPFTEDLNALKKLSDFLSPLPQTSVFAFIFLKNVAAVLLGVVLSPFFCLVPVAALVLNGGLLGLVSTSVIQEKSLGYLLAGVLPHGIFELPALFIGEAAALSFGTAVMLAVVNPEKRKLVMPNLRQNIKYLALAVILLFPAALIETYVTPLLVR
jgi:stage II sporulation protein M